MKKFWKTLMVAALGVFALSSCEDVPAPYAIPGQGGNGSVGTLLTVDLTSGQGAWTTQDKGTLTGVWYHSDQYGMVASGYKNGSNNAAESWLISPQIDLTKATEVTMSLNEAVNKIGEGSVAENMTVWVSTDNGETWEPITSDSRPAGTSWTFQEDEFDLSAYDGKTIQLGFKYISTTESAGSWEIKGLTLKGVGEATIEGGSVEPTSATEVTCAEAVELTNALADGETSTETYSVTGYITEVPYNASNGQQTFWMADTKDGGRVFEAYYANLPEGVSTFTTGMKVKITGKLMKYVKDSNVTAEIKNATVEILEDGDGGEDTPTTGTEVTCAEAVELTNALADGGSSTETYTITGYITEVIGSVSTKTGSPQQSFWMADTKDGGKVFEAYYANVPDGVSAFTVGSKVKITGKLTKYVKDGAVTAEIKNATVEILESGNGEDTPDTPDTPSDPDQTVEGNSITFSTQGYENAQDFNDKSIAVGDATLTFSKGSGSTTPKYYATGSGMRLYGGNTLTISSSKTISKIVFTYDSGQDQSSRPLYATSSNTSFTPGTYDYDAQTWNGSDSSIVMSYTGQGGHVRIQSITITYAE